jgi:DNA polymerase-1
VLVGVTETLAALTLSWGGRPVVAHDWKTIATGEQPCDAPPLEHDTMVAAYLLDPAGRAYPLLEIAERDGIGAKVEGLENGAAELAERAVLTRELAERQRVEMEEQGLTGLFRDVELPLVDVLVEMERTGVKLDTTALARIGEKVETRIGELEREVWDLAGEEFTIGSPQQLGEILFNKLALSRKRRGKTGFSTDARVLQAIRSEHPIIEKVESWREYSKLKSTYLDALPLLVDAESRPRRDGCRAPIPTSRTSRSAPSWDARSASASWPRRATS